MVARVSFQTGLIVQPVFTGICGPYSGILITRVNKVIKADKVGRGINKLCGTLDTAENSVGKATGNRFVALKDASAKRALAREVKRAVIGVGVFRRGGRRAGIVLLRV